MLKQPMIEKLVALRLLGMADGILDRLVHNVHRIEMKGDSMRKSRTKANPQVKHQPQVDQHFATYAEPTVCG